MRPNWKRVGIAALSVVAVAAVCLIPIGSEPVAEATSRTEPVMLNLSQFSDAPPKERLNLVFLHHSVGSHLLASPEKDPAHGGGLADLLAKNNYTVHEATYGSRLGENTDLFDWLPKFRDQMQGVLSIDNQDSTLPSGQRNRVVLFKSCFPNNEFSGVGDGDGNASGPELTVVNAKATLKALLPEFAKHQDVLFVYLTIPPLAPKPWSEPMWKLGAKKLFGKPSNADKLKGWAALARGFNDWTVSPEGWLKDYPHTNVVAFDLFGVLTDGGSLLRYTGTDGTDSHPTRDGSAKAAAALVPFINRSVHRAKLVPE
jgi:hypothetical protein